MHVGDGVGRTPGDAQVDVRADWPVDTVARRTVAPLSIAAQQALSETSTTLGEEVFSPHGSDLRAVLLALDADVDFGRGRSTARLRKILEQRTQLDSQLVRGFSFARPDRHAYLRFSRRRPHPGTIVAVAVASAHGRIRVSASGAAPDAVRLELVEHAVADGLPPVEAAQHALEHADPPDDFVASAWQRARALGPLVRLALDAASDQLGPLPEVDEVRRALAVSVDGRTVGIPDTAFVSVTDTLLEHGFGIG